MDDVWFGSNFTDRDIALVVRSLSLQGPTLPPLLAVADRGSRVVLASRALLRFFDVQDGDALPERLLAGRDPGARRLAFLCQNLAIDGAPRLERLRFLVSPASEIVTFLCRRILFRDDRPLFVAAALGLRADSASRGAGSAPVPAAPRAGLADSTGPVRRSAPEAEAPVPVTADRSARHAPAADDPSPLPPPAAPQSLAAVQAGLRARWPSNRSLRFLWQTDADCVCTVVSPQLAQVVGAVNADLVGRNLLEIAPRLDPSGALARLLAGKTSWDAVGVDWPIADAGATARVLLGAMPGFDSTRQFEGYKGYGIIRLDALREGDRRPLIGPAPDDTPGRVVAFPAGLHRALSREDHNTFTTIGEELRDQVGSGEAADALAEGASPTREAPGGEGAAQHHDRAREIARNGLAVFDRLSVAVLVSRNDVPIFANRAMLDLTGFADEDALHAAGGLSFLFDGPADPAGDQRIGIRTREGTVKPVTARMQRLAWDGLPATLLTLQSVDRPAASDAGQDSTPRDEERPVVPRDRETPSLTEIDELRDLRAILETATDGVAVIDARCNVLSLNRSGEALFGCDRSVVIGKPFLDLFAVHNRSLAADYFNGLKSNPTQSLLNDGREFLVQAHEDGTIPVFMTLGRLGSQDGGTSPPRFCALFRDLTPWKKVEHDLQAARDAAERASALKSDFLARVSHEIRTPLNAIIGFAEALLQERFGPFGNPRYKDDLRDIHASGLHVMSLVNDLLDLSKIEAGRMELAPRPLDVNKIITETVSLMQPQANRERVIMRLSLAPTLPPINADDRSLRQIILNVLSNAVKFNEPGGQVIVATTSTDEGHVVLRFRDTGIGMSDSDLAAAMEPFRQLDRDRASVRGTGLGLPLIKALAEANEASFTIRSQLAQGTMIEVSFPPRRVLTRSGNA